MSTRRSTTRRRRRARDVATRTQGGGRLLPPRARDAGGQRPPQRRHAAVSCCSRWGKRSGAPATSTRPRRRSAGPPAWPGPGRRRADLARAALGFGGPFAAFETGTVDEPLVDLLETGTRQSRRGRRRAARPCDEPSGRSPDLLPGPRPRSRAERAGGRDGPPARRPRRRSPTRWSARTGRPGGPRISTGGSRSRRRYSSWPSRRARSARRCRYGVWRLAHLLETRDIAAVDEDFEACRRLAGQLRQPYNLWQVATIDATLALLEGRFSEVEQLAQEALRSARRPRIATRSRLRRADTAAAPGGGPPWELEPA